MTHFTEPISVELEQALRLRAQANHARENLSRMIIAIASVEALASNELWTDKQKEMLQSFTDASRDYPGATDREIEEVVERVIGLSKLSVNQGFRRLFDRLGVEHLWQPWQHVYHFRSRVLHGDLRPEEVLTTVDEAMRLSREIVLTAAAREIPGADIPLGTSSASETT